MQLDLTILQQCWFLAGPTACGKTAVGLALAEQLGAEILSLDSMAVYRGMDIGTAKPTFEERARVPHYLIDLVEPSQEYSTARYLEAAAIACREILDRERVPLFVGGTGLYLRAVLRGLFASPPKDPVFRRRLSEEAAASSPEHLFRRLRRIDPATAARLHANDLRRVIRALEIHHVTGRPASELRTQQPLPAEQRPQTVFWLQPPRDWLYDRIERRVEQMMAAGFVDEVRRILDAPQQPSHTACQALGYREIIDHLEGRCRLDEAVTRIKLRTRQFAKRQHTWFRNLEECRGLPIAGSESSTGIAERILQVASACETTPGV